jgi:hypothetical protein
LDEATQHELIRRFEAPGSLRDKWIVMHLLAFGGDAKVVDVLGHALTNTYAGQPVVDQEECVLTRMVYLLGVTARRHPEVVAFLDQARDPDYWSGVKLWQGRDPARSLQGAAIKAMAWTGLPAAEEMLRAYREDPKPAVKGNVTGAVVGAACILHTVRRYGFDDAWDLLNPPRDESGMGTFSKWVEEVPEAREWRAWSWQARGAR